MCQSALKLDYLLESMKKKVADMGFTIIKVTPLTELSNLILARK